MSIDVSYKTVGTGRAQVGGTITAETAEGEGE